MASVDVTKQSGMPHNVHMITWTPLTEADTAVPLAIPGAADKTVQITGNFGTGGSVTIRGSNDNVTYFDLTDPQGNAITKTGPAMEIIEENPFWIKPVITAGTGVSLTIILCARSSI